MENLVSLVYSIVTCSACPLIEIDSISAKGEPSKSSLQFSYSLTEIDSISANGEPSKSSLQ